MQDGCTTHDFRLAFCQATGSLCTDVQIEIWKKVIQQEVRCPDAPKKDRTLHLRHELQRSWNHSSNSSGKSHLRRRRLFDLWSSDYLVKLRMHELKMQSLNERMNEYMICCSEIERFKEIETRNIEKERFYSKFTSWRPSVRHTEFTHEDKLMEAQVRLHEIVERCRDFEEREKIFKKATFGRLASRIDF